MIWADQIDAARENGAQGKRTYGADYEVTELMAEIAEKRAQGPFKGDDDPDSD